MKNRIKEFRSSIEKIFLFKESERKSRVQQSGGVV